MKPPETIKKEVLGFLSALANRKRKEIEHIQSTIDLIIRPGLEVPVENLLGVLAENVPQLPKERKIRVLQPIDTFNPKGKLDHKIAYALTNLGSGFREDILEVIHPLQPDKDPRKVAEAMAVRLSYLLKNGYIKARLVGRRYEYSFVGCGVGAEDFR